MKTIIVKSWQATGVAIAIALFMSVATSYAGVVVNGLETSEVNLENGGNVLPPKAEPKGYSLSDVAKATAAFNVTDHSGPFPDVVNRKPFQGLFWSTNNPTNTFEVSSRTMLYVPIVAIDDSPPVYPHFPANVNNRNALEKFFYSQIEGAGTVYTNITVDGKVTTLDDNYVVGVKVPPLPDGNGTQYITVAAFLTPLKKGSHTVKISALQTGHDTCQFFTCPPGFEFSVVYTVNVH